MTTHEMLRRLLQRSEGQEAEPQGELSPGRILRTSIARAADVDAGLLLTVLGVVDERLSLDPILKRLDESLLLFGLTRGGETIGFAGIDLETRSVIVERQTTGRLKEAAATERAISAGDIELCRPLIDGALREIRCLAEAPPLAGWTNGVSTGPRLPGRQALGLVLDDDTYRYVEATLDFGIGDRQGKAVICLPFAQGKARAEARSNAKNASFGRELREAVLEAPAALHAVLHRIRLPLSQVEGFAAGDVLALPGISVGSVRLEGPDGKSVTSARLGQAMGLRAVRLELAAPNELREVDLVEPPASPASMDPANPAGTAPERAPSQITHAET